MPQPSQSRDEWRELARTARWLGGFLPLVVVVVTTTVVVDPGRVIRLGAGDRDAYERQIAQAIAGGDNVTNLLPFDERVAQRELAFRVAVPREVLIMGSSRMLQVRPDRPDPLAVRNVGVAGASMEDLLGLYEMYVVRRSTYPHGLVVGVDPWMLNARSGQTRWKAMRSEYAAARAALGLPTRVLPAVDWERIHARLSAAFSPDYLKESLRLLLLRLRGGGRLILTRAPASDGLSRLADGSLRYDRASRNVSARSVLAAAREYALSTPVYGLGGFDRVDGGALEELNALLRDACRRGIAVAVVLPPYHPVVYARFQRRPEHRMVAVTEREVRRLAGQNGLAVVGSWNPERAKALPEDFLDGMHLTERGVAKVLPLQELIDRLRTCPRSPATGGRQ